MILGLGMDLVDVARIKAARRRHGQKFLDRFLLPAEQAYCLAHRDPSTHLAVRLAAKEAVAKAFGTGIGAELGWLDIEVVRGETGQPFIRLHGKGQALLEQRRARVVHLTLTHTSAQAAAVAVLEK